MNDRYMKNAPHFQERFRTKLRSPKGKCSRDRSLGCANLKLFLIYNWKDSFAPDLECKCDFRDVFPFASEV